MRGRRKKRLSRGELASPAIQEARRTLSAYGLAVRKTRGQHFLVEANVLDTVLRAAEIRAGDVAFEIGPGLGALTKALAARDAIVVAVELDDGLYHALAVETPSWGDVRLIHGDVLDLDVSQTLTAAGLGSRPFKLVANLPYGITSPVLRMFLGSRPAPEIVAVMVQREVAQRVAAEPGRFSYLSVVARLYGTPSIEARVPRTAFYPPPDVESAVLKIAPHKRPALDLDDRSRFLEVVLAGFGHPRKQLHNALSRKFRFEEDEAKKLLASLDIEPTRRAQTLSLDEWRRLYEKAADRML